MKYNRKCETTPITKKPKNNLISNIERMCKMNNILYFYNMGTRDSNVSIFKIIASQDLGLYEDDLEMIVSGYEFIIDRENRSKVRVLFFDNGCQLMTVFQGESAEDTIKVYEAFTNKFYQSN